MIELKNLRERFNNRLGHAEERISDIDRSLLFLKYLFIYLSIYLFIYLFDRDRDSVIGGGAEREGGKIPSRLHTNSTGPNMGLKLTKL